MSLTNVFRRAIVNSPKRRASSGVAALEFALALPIWITLLIGGADAAYCTLVNQRVERVTYTVTDLVTQSQKVSISDLDKILAASEQIMRPFDFGDKGYVIISSVFKEAGKSSIIKWQYAGGGHYNCGGGGGCGSKVGVEGGVPTMPNKMALNDGDNVIVVEVYYKFTPMFVNASIFSASDIYRAAVYKPRLSALTAKPT
ncbi:MAG: TadE/TadG family type IV pilus assembly protein [Alphaproteobacteria bacterium]|nr:TadE/TadG family type IV pilus assembly protein [Alphaproteobacteria bacterium]